MTSEKLSGEIAVTAKPDLDAPPDKATPDDGLGQASRSGRDGPGTVASDGAAPHDPWFEPEPKTAQPDPPHVAGLPDGTGLPDGAGLADAAGWPAAAGAAAGSGSQAQWFLPTGRAGLLPESMTESWDEGQERDPGRAEAAGAPPWASDGPAPSVDSPPPWESGPWPGPGESHPGGPSPAGANPAGRSSGGRSSGGRHKRRRTKRRRRGPSRTGCGTGRREPGQPVRDCG